MEEVGDNTQAQVHLWAQTRVWVLSSFKFNLSHEFTWCPWTSHSLVLGSSVPGGGVGNAEFFRSLNYVK